MAPLGVQRHLDFRGLPFSPSSHIRPPLRLKSGESQFSLGHDEVHVLAVLVVPDELHDGRIGSVEGSAIRLLVRFLRFANCSNSHREAMYWSTSGGGRGKARYGTAGVRGGHNGIYLYRCCFRPVPFRELRKN